MALALITIISLNLPLELESENPYIKRRMSIYDELFVTKMTIYNENILILTKKSHFCKK